MKLIHIYPFLFVTMLLWSCGGSGDGPEPTPVIPAPLASTLIFPDDNEECTEGSILSDTQSSVTFMWNASENTDTYTLQWVNLQTGEQSSANTTSTERSVTLDRGMPYSWSVVSKANGTTETAVSETWRFYNAGAPTENYAPFPAFDPNPAMGVAVDAGNITLQWDSSDLDGDILSYSVYLDTSSPPSTLLGSTDIKSYETTVSANTVYYWRVICIDDVGNASESEIFEFRTNP